MRRVARSINLSPGSLSRALPSSGDATKRPLGIIYSPRLIRIPDNLDTILLSNCRPSLTTASPPSMKYPSNHARGLAFAIPTTHAGLRLSASVLQSGHSTLSMCQRISLSGM
jgi:hypothetical protein